MDGMTDDRKRALATDLVFGDPSVPLSELIKEHGIDISEYIEWIRDGAFTEYLAELWRSAAGAEDARIMRSLARLSMNGDIKAIKLYFDLLRERQSGGAYAAESDDGGIADVCRELWGDIT